MHRNLRRRLRLIRMFKIPFALLFLAGATVLATSRAESDAAFAAEATPAAAEVIGELYEFDRFQQDAIESADARGNEEIRAFALAHADAAQKRDKALTKIQEEVNTDPAFDCQARPRRADRLTALQTFDGPDYVRNFYTVEVAEHRSAIALLQRYLASPDSETVRAFVAEQLSTLRAALEDAEAGLGDE
ncbi:DUF4142 domain-containing protein [Bradyrhizobium sp. STM 3562]|uniref:DUF4142 domain-containing protein n=1 Tax=Bradyrhizobium sp. STM 3562 TaxID=578924 RepID=UPI0038902C9F